MGIQQELDSIGVESNRSSRKREQREGITDENNQMNSPEEKDVEFQMQRAH